ncbi:MAG: hypothetical protein ABIH67_05610 [Candidatus Uhrbacteria bacterium]
MITNYRNWLLPELIRLGGNDLCDLFIEVVNLMEKIRSLQTDRLVMLQIIPGSSLHYLGKSLRRLCKNCPASIIPVQGLMADYMVIKGEIADFSLRSSDPIQPPETMSDEEVGEIRKVLAGLGTLQEVSGCYFSAAHTYHRCIVEMAEILEQSEPDDPRRCMFVATWQYVSSHFTAKSRALLMELSFLLKKKDPDDQICIASGTEIMPRAIQYPELMEQVVNRGNLNGTLWIIDHYKDLPFPDAHTVLAFFNNVATIAMLMRDYAGARQALQIALSHCLTRPPTVLINNIELLDMLDPKIQA